MLDRNRLERVVWCCRRANIIESMYWFASFRGWSVVSRLCGRVHIHDIHTYYIYIYMCVWQSLICSGIRFSYRLDSFTIPVSSPYWALVKPCLNPFEAFSYAPTNSLDIDFCSTELWHWTNEKPPYIQYQEKMLTTIFI